MPWTTAELIELLKNLPEIELLEILEISSEDLIMAFGERISERETQLRYNLGISG
jgi:hypothetical protein